MIKRKRYSLRSRMNGVTLVESLVALVVIGVGMLGIAGLYLASLKAGRTANYRVQAVNLVADMADRIRANKKGKASYNAAAASNSCTAVNADTRCTPAQVAQNDKFVWNQAIADSLRNMGAAGTVAHTALPATGALTDSYLVTITWRVAGDDTDSSYFVTVQQ